MVFGNTLDRDSVLVEAIAKALISKVDQRDNPALCGLITRRNIFEVYNREVLHHQDMGINLVTGEARMLDCVELPDEYKVQLFTPPGEWIGSNLQDLALRKR